jgi:PAS domain-containing protein
MVDSTNKDSAAYAANRLQIRFTGALAVIGVLILLTLLVTQWLLAGQQQATHVISVASQQRTLGQQIVKSAYRLVGVGTTEARRSAIEEMQSALEQLRRTHAGLKNGSDELDLPGNSGRLSLLYAQIESAYFAFSDEAAKVLAAAETPGALHQAVQRLGQYESVFMDGMNQVVAGYESEFSKRIGYARWLGLALGLLTLAALVIAARKVFLPTMAGIQRNMKDRESGEAEMEKIFSDSPAALFIVDATSLAIERGNRKAELLSGYSDENLPGRPFSSCFDTRFDANKVFVQKIRAGETFDDLSVMLIDARHKAVDALASMRPVTYAGLRRYLVSLTDLTRASRR